MKKLFALMLSILLSISVCSCGAKKEAVQNNSSEAHTTESTVDTSDPSQEVPSDSESSVLSGQWVCPLSAEDTVAINGQSLETIMGGFTPEQIGCTSTMNIYLDFNADGTATFTQRGAELDAVMLDLYTCFYTYISDYTVASELYDMDNAHLDYNAHEQYGVSTWPEAMQKVIDDMTAKAEENPTGDAVSQISYTVEGDTVTLTYLSDNTTEVYTLSDNTLTCIATDNFAGDPKVFTYTKQGLEQILEGEWRAETNYLDAFSYTGTNAEDFFNQILSSYEITVADLGITVPDSLPITYIITFSEGKALHSAEAPEYFAFLGTFYDTFADYISDPVIFAKSYYEGGISELEALAAEAGITVEEFMADELEYIRSTDEAMAENLAAISSEGNYSVDGDLVIVSSDVDSVEYEYIDGNLVTADLVFVKQ